VDLESLLRAFALAGAIALLGCIGVQVVGMATRALAPVYGTSLRFLLAVLTVSAPYAELIETRARRTRAIPKEEWLGFSPAGGV
jgi:hypothetical protein